ncbi:MAG: 2,3-bisphosphoglycerate-independent phosphoglycerate mutase [Eggerthellaceae bacterium]|nr:2,3-bisphosphoglycerate-independent phosphoglycerate mutase [Eggerthellaceae bacterium]
MSKQPRKPVCLCIMDGYGLAPKSPGNAIENAEKPFLDRIFAQDNWTKLHASGEYVGLPEGQMGNSEVGHLNIGAGRIVFQEISRINNACKDGSIYENKVLIHAMDATKEVKSSVLHILGLISDGGVHSHNKHLYALLDMAGQRGVEHISVHCFMDGRDVPPTSGKNYIQDLEDKIAENNAKYYGTKIQIASISGRYYAMDRNNHWERIADAYKCLTQADPLSNKSPVEFIQASYEEDVTDEFIVPGAFDPRGMKDEDSVIFFNFRPDRAREITRAFVDQDFSSFDRGQMLKLNYVCMTEYDPTISAPIAFHKHIPENVLADVFEANSLTQLHIAETEKYAHVTFFFNGGVEKPEPHETRILIPSPNVATYDLEPEMSAPEAADILVRNIKEDAADVYIINFANPDMVGHTGVLEAAIKAIEAVDKAVEKVVHTIEDKQGTIFITADHGNADKMIAPDGSPHTAHTTALVPFIVCDFSGHDYKCKKRVGSLRDIAPTILYALGIQSSAEMTGENLCR